MSNLPPDPMDQFGSTPEEIKDALLQIKEDEKRQQEEANYICICGHTARSHTSHSTKDTHKSLALSGRFACISGNQTCPCQEVRTVAKSSNARYFLQKTTGVGIQHALFKGWATAKSRDETVEWLPGVCCDMCQATNKALNPVAVSAENQLSRTPERNNGLLCTDCLEIIRRGGN